MKSTGLFVCEWTASHNYNYNSNTELQNLVVPRNFLEFRGNMEIPRQRPNSAARGKLWSLFMGAHRHGQGDTSPPSLEML